MCVSPSHTSQTALQLLEGEHSWKAGHNSGTLGYQVKVWTQTQVICESFPSFSPPDLYTQQGPSEDIQSGGEAGVAHRQHQEDGGVTVTGLGFTLFPNNFCASSSSPPSLCPSLPPSPSFLPPFLLPSVPLSLPLPSSFLLLPPPHRLHETCTAVRQSPKEHRKIWG